jgi:hypothetical protein
MAEAVYAGTTSDLEAYLELFNRLDTFFADVIASSTATNPASNRS